MTIGIQDWHKLQDSVYCVLKADYWLATDTDIELFWNDLMIHFKQRGVNVASTDGIQHIVLMPSENPSITMPQKTHPTVAKARAAKAAREEAEELLMRTRPLTDDPLPFDPEDFGLVEDTLIDHALVAAEVRHQEIRRREADPRLKDGSGAGNSDQPATPYNPRRSRVLRVKFSEAQNDGLAGHPALMVKNVDDNPIPQKSDNA